MIAKEPSPQPDHVRVRFELPACTWADKICVVGDFNEWQPNTTPLMCDRDGIWRATLDLPSSRVYEFRYLMDGVWHTDSHADGLADSPFGSQNSVVVTTLSITKLPLVERLLSCEQIFQIKSRVSHRRVVPQPPRGAQASIAARVQPSDVRARAPQAA